MDFISVIGLVGFISAIIYGLEGQWDIFWTGEGISIVIGGSFGAVMLRSTAGEFFNMFPTILKIFRHKIDKPVDLIDQMVELATIARKDGMIALENQEVSNRFLQKGVRALVDGNDAVFIRSSLQRDTMSIALLTTFYGAVMANGIFLPMAQKLENHAKREQLNNEMIIEGVIFIQKGGNPRLLEDLLSSFLSPKILKKRLAAQGG